MTKNSKPKSSAIRYASQEGSLYPRDQVKEIATMIRASAELLAIIHKMLVGLSYSFEKYGGSAKTRRQKGNMSPMPSFVPGPFPAKEGE